MAVITCPDCGKKFTVADTSREFVFCPYCGAQFEIAPFVRAASSNQNSDHAEPAHKKRKAKPKQNEPDHESNAYQTGYAVAKGIRFYRANKRKCNIAAVVLVILFFVGGTALSNHAAKQQALAAHQAELAQLKEEETAASHLAMGEVKLPDIEIGMATDYRIVKQDLEDAGFTNITTEPVADLTNTTTARYNAVIEVTVDGVPRMNTGEWYKLDVPIVISYHTVGDTILTPAEETYSIAQGLLHGATSTLNDAADKLNSAADHIAQTAGESDYDYAFVREGLDYSVYYLVDLDNALVYSADEYADDRIPSATVGHITSGDLETGLVVQFNYLSGWDETLTLDGDGMILTDGNGHTRRFSKERIYVAEAALKAAVLEQEN